MHSAMGWCKHGYINQMDKLALNRFQGIAGRSNTQHRMLNEKKEKELVIQNFRIIYQIMGNVVIIHGIIDGRRDIRETMRQRILI